MARALALLPWLVSGRSEPDGFGANAPIRRRALADKAEKKADKAKKKYFASLNRG